MKGGFSMELHAQIKKYRANMKLSQEELADRVFVTRHGPVIIGLN